MKKGFTWIEWLSVLVMIGMLCMIVVPVVEGYQIEEQKEKYIQVARDYIKEVESMVKEKTLSLVDENTTYYIPIRCVPTLDEESPYGKWKEAYVVVFYQQGEYDYYWTSYDENGKGISLTNQNLLDTESIQENMSSIDTSQGISSYENIVFYDWNNQVCEKKA